MPSKSSAAQTSGANLDGPKVPTSNPAGPVTKVREVRSAAATASLRERVEWRVTCALEPFLVPDVTPSGESFTEVFHILRDKVDEGSLVHDAHGYRRPT